MSKPLLSVVIPIYNEKNTCEKLINRVKKVSISKQIVVVDDGSTDGSKEILMKIEGIELFHNSANLGKGNAVRLALKSCIGKYVILQDGDLEYDPSSYHELLFPLISNKADVVFGSRWLKVTDANNYHTLGNRLITWFSNQINRSSITDMASCYKVLSLEDINSLKLKSDGFGLEAEITAKVHRLGLRIKEVHVKYKRRSKKDGKKLRIIDGAVSALSCHWYRYID